MLCFLSLFLQNCKLIYNLNVEHLVYSIQKDGGLDSKECLISRRGVIIEVYEVQKHGHQILNHKNKDDAVAQIFCVRQIRINICG